MWHVKKGKKYVILKEMNKGDISFKDVICESEFTNFQEGQMEIETTKGEYYPLYAVYETKELAVKDYLKHIKDIKKILNKDIKEKEKEIKENEKRILEIEESIKKVEKKYKTILKKG